MRKYSIPLIIFLVSSACQAPSGLDEKKDQLTEYKKELTDLKGKIGSLETEIMEMDSTYRNGSNNSILVTAIEIEEKFFEHKVEFRGSVESRKDVIISSEIPGKIKAVKVREGQAVTKGMVMIVLDADIIRNNIAELKNSLDLANIIYERQARLWEQNIGTEIQYLEAKNTRKSLERRLITANSELARAIIRAPFSGSVDQIPAKEGEIAQPGTPLIRIVNPNDVYIKADISERFIGKFKKGDRTEIYFPTQDRKITSTVSSVSHVINNENRTFEIEIYVPAVDFVLKPNQVTVLRLTDYVNENAFTIPTRLIQKDDKGTFVYIVEEEEGKAVARKVHISAGISYDSETEIIKGLNKDHRIVDKGFRELSNGVLVSLKIEKEQSMAASK